MRDLILDLESAGGIDRTRHLRELGHSPYRIAAAVQSGRVLRPRIGWLALPSTDLTARRAIALGGRLASGNALSSYAIWVQRVVGVAIHCAANSARLPPLGSGERRTRRRLAFDGGSDVWRVSVADALIQFSYEATPREWLASVDSALHAALISPATLLELWRFVPAEHRRLIPLADPRAASGNETYARLLARGAGLRVESQVGIPLVGDIDLLVDGWLIIEVDSHEFHGSREDQDRDRRRDGNAQLLGYDTLRFMPEALFAAPDWCLAVIQARLRAGRPSLESGRGAGKLRLTS